MLDLDCEASTLVVGSTFLERSGQEVLWLCNNFAIFVLEVLLNMVFVLHVLVCGVDWLFDVSSGFECTIMFSRLGNRFAITHLHSAASGIRLTILKDSVSNTEQGNVTTSLLSWSGLDVSRFSDNLSVLIFP